MIDAYPEIHRLLQQGRPVALAVIVTAKGSTPRKAGAKLILTPDGKAQGTIGGGCIEAAVLQAAQVVLEEGTPRLLPFDLTDEDAADAGLICGGRLEVWIQRFDPPATGDDSLQE
jgi:xanthine dehydrogenase accessory factor